MSLPVLLRRGWLVAVVLLGWSVACPLRAEGPPDTELADAQEVEETVEQAPEKESDASESAESSESESAESSSEPAKSGETKQPKSEQKDKSDEQTSDGEKPQEPKKSAAGEPPTQSEKSDEAPPAEPAKPVTEPAEKEMATEDSPSEEPSIEPPGDDIPVTEPDDQDKPTTDESAPKKKRVIGATATVLEKTSGFSFRARVDTGAKSCSLHVEKVLIEDEQEKWEDNYGKVATILVVGIKGKQQWIKSKIVGHVIVKTSVESERRYKVPMVFRWKDCEKKVLVTLNNRAHMEYPLLLGRNFLAGDFVVDVELNGDD
jgi:hypothetical protein